MEFAAADMRRRDESEGDVAMAWYVAALSRQERLPKLSTILERMRAVNSATGLVNQVQALSKQLGIPVRPISDEARMAWRNVKES